MLKFTENFSMTFAENRTYGVPEFAGTEVNRHSSKLNGLSGYLQNHYPHVMKSPMGQFRRSQVASSQVQHHHKFNFIYTRYILYILAHPKTLLAVCVTIIIIIKR